MSTNWKLFAAAGAVVAGAVAVYYFMNKGNLTITLGEEEIDNFKEEMKSDLDKLGEIKKEASGILKLHDFMELFKLVTKHAKKKIS